MMAILIESQWNLNNFPASGWESGYFNINRITVEFK